MKKLLVLALCLVAAGVVFAGEGKSCRKGDVQSVQLTGTVACTEGSGADCVRVFRVADSETQYKVCDQSKADLASLDGAQVRITGKIVTCSEGKELMIDTASRV